MRKLIHDVSRAVLRVRRLLALAGLVSAVSAASAQPLLNVQRNANGTLVVGGVTASLSLGTGAVLTNSGSIVGAGSLSLSGNVTGATGSYSALWVNGSQITPGGIGTVTGLTVSGSTGLTVGVTGSTVSPLVTLTLSDALLGWNATTSASFPNFTQLSGSLSSYATLANLSASISATQPLSANLTGWAGTSSASYLTAAQVSSSLSAYQLITANLTGWAATSSASYPTFANLSGSLSSYQPLAANLTGWAATSSASYPTLGGANTFIAANSLENSTAADGFSTINSPKLYLKSRAWNGSASELIEFGLGVTGRINASNPSKLTIVAGSGIDSTIFTLDQTGTLTLGGGLVSSSGSFTGTLTASNLTGTNTGDQLTFPAASISGTLTNGQLITPTFSLGGTTISLGQSVTTLTSLSLSSLTVSGLSTAGFVVNNAAGLLSTTSSIGVGSLSGTLATISVSGQTPFALTSGSTLAFAAGTNTTLTLAAGVLTINSQSNNGTVTGFVVTPSNGVLAGVTTSASVPTLTISLGAITPTSISNSGTTSLAGASTLGSTLVVGGLTTLNSGTLAGTISLTSSLVGGGSLFTASSSGVTPTTVTAGGTLNIQAGSNITITGAAGTLTISGSAGGSGTVTQVTSADASIAVATSTSTPVLTLTSSIPVTKLNAGTGASASTYWRGDGTWATPSSGLSTASASSGLIANLISSTAVSYGSPIFLKITGSASPVLNSASLSLAPGSTFSVSSSPTVSGSGLINIAANSLTLGGNLVTTGANLVSSWSNSGTLSNSGAVTMGSTLVVAGNTSLSGALRVGTSVTATSTITLAQNTWISNSNSLTVSGGVLYAANATVTGGSFTTSGNVTAANVSTGGTVYADGGFLTSTGGIEATSGTATFSGLYVTSSGVQFTGLTNASTGYVLYYDNTYGYVFYDSTPSDPRTKDNIAPLGLGLNEVNSLVSAGVDIQFNYKAGFNSRPDLRRGGVNAAVLASVSPLLTKDVGKMNNVEHVLEPDDRALLGMALRAISELSAENKALKARLDKLEAATSTTTTSNP